VCADFDHHFHPEIEVWGAWSVQGGHFEKLSCGQLFKVPGDFRYFCLIILIFLFGVPECRLMPLFVGSCLAPHDSLSLIGSNLLRVEHQIGCLHCGHCASLHCWPAFDRVRLRTFVILFEPYPIVIPLRIPSSRVNHTL
jgi:hypothetical protein